MPHANREGEPPGEPGLIAAQQELRPPKKPLPHANRQGEPPGEPGLIAAQQELRPPKKAMPHANRQGEPPGEPGLIAAQQELRPPKKPLPHANRQGEPPGEPGLIAAQQELRPPKKAMPHANRQGEPPGEPGLIAAQQELRPPGNTYQRADREGEPPGEPGIAAGSDGASPSPDRPGAAAGLDRPASSLSNLAAGLLSGRWAAHRGPAERHTSATDAAAEPLTAADAPRSIRNRSFIRAIARLGIEAAEAVAHAHDQGIVHRDIKPANILLNQKGELWVADFGMADVQGRDGLTMTGDLPGTLRYMSPEQALGKRSLVDRRTDIYAWARPCTSYLRCKPVVPGTDKQEMLRRIADDEPDPLRKFNPAMPVDLATIVAKCLAKDPANRYQTAWQLADELTRFLDGRPIAARSGGSDGPRLAVVPAQARAGDTCGGPDPLGSRRAWPESVGTGGTPCGSDTRLSNKKSWCKRRKQQTAHERDQKEAQRAKADAINRFLIDKLLLQAAPEHNQTPARSRFARPWTTPPRRSPRRFRASHRSRRLSDWLWDRPITSLASSRESETHLRRSLELTRQQQNASVVDEIRCITELGHILAHLGRTAEAETLLRQATDQGRRALGASHETTLLATRYLAALYGSTGRRREGEAMLRQSLEEARRSGRGDSAETGAAMSELAGILLLDGRFAETEGLYRTCLKFQLETSGPPSRRLGDEEQPGIRARQDWGALRRPRPFSARHSRPSDRSSVRSTP